eukprot:scpid6932/ scgid35699/ 
MISSVSEIRPRDMPAREWTACVGNGRPLPVTAAGQLGIACRFAIMFRQIGFILASREGLKLFVEAEGDYWRDAVGALHGCARISDDTGPAPWRFRRLLMRHLESRYNKNLVIFLRIPFEGYCCHTIQEQRGEEFGRIVCVCDHQWGTS